MAAGWPSMDVQTKGRTEGEAIQALKSAIRAAVPTDTPAASCQRLVLLSLLDKCVTYLGHGCLQVEALPLTQLEQAVQVACTKAGPQAWANYASAYNKSLQPVLADLRDLATQQKPAREATTVLLRADVLLARMAVSTASRTASSAGSTSLVPGSPPAAAASAPTQLGPLRFEVDPQALPFPQSNGSPDAVRRALSQGIRSLGIAALPQAALAAVLQHSTLEQSMGAQQEELLLHAAGAKQAQRTLQAVLRRRVLGGEALVAEFKGQYGGRLVRLLAEQRDCTRLVRLQLGPGGGQHAARALLRADLLLGGACRVKGGLPAGEQAEGSRQQSQGQQPGAPMEDAIHAAAVPATPARKTGGRSAQGRKAKQQEEQAHQQEAMQQQRAMQQQAGQRQQAVQQQSGQQRARQQEAAQQGPPAVRGGTDEAALANPACLLAELQAAQGLKEAASAGIEPLLVGRYMAALCNTRPQEQNAQVGVLLKLLDDSEWQMAASFMQSTVLMAGLQEEAKVQNAISEAEAFIWELDP